MPNKEIVTTVVLGAGLAARLERLSDLRVAVRWQRSTMLFALRFNLAIDVRERHLSSTFHCPNDVLSQRRYILHGALHAFCGSRRPEMIDVAIF
jgi:hypothetical protein